MGLSGFFEKLGEGGRERAYQRGVNEISEDPVIFFDADAFEDKDPSEYAEILVNQFERQAPGITEVMIENYKEEVNPNPTAEELSDMLRAAAEGLIESGPAAIADAVEIDGRTYGIAVMPNNDLDTKTELLTVFLETDFEEDQIETIIDNMPGSSKEWARIVGNHEGEHLNREDGSLSSIDTLNEEARADRSAIATYEARGKDDVALAFKDLRHLTASPFDTEHSTGPLLDSGDQASIVHLETAGSYQSIMAMEIAKSPEFEAYLRAEHGLAEGTSAIESNFTTDQLNGFREQNPDQYFEIINNGINTQISDAMDAYNKDPTSMEAIGGAVVTQTFTDYARNFEGAYRRRVMGEDVPEHEPTQLIPQEQEDAYYAHALHEAKIDAELENLRYEGIYEYNDHKAFENFDWEGYEGDAQNVWQLKRDDEGLYNEVYADYLTQEGAAASEAYKKDPSYENTETLIKIELATNDHIDDTNFYNEHYAEPSDTPPAEIPHVDLISDEATRAHLEERLEQQKPEAVSIQFDENGKEIQPAPAESSPEHNHGGIVPDHNHGEAPPPSPRFEEQDNLINYQEGVNGTPYTTMVSNLPEGEPTVDFEGGVTVGESSMGSVFAQSANPDPESVTMVDATVEATADIDPSTIQPPAFTQTEYATQGLN